MVAPCNCHDNISKRPLTFHRQKFRLAHSHRHVLYGLVLQFSGGRGALETIINRGEGEGGWEREKVDRGELMRFNVSKD